jgi:hypothetical protein
VSTSSAALFEINTARPRSLFIADADFEIIASFAIAQADASSATLVLLGSDASFPFRPRPSTIIVPGMPEGVIASMPTLESAGIASRLASAMDLAGCFDGSVTELASKWLAAQPIEALQSMTIYAAGSPESLQRAAETGRSFGVPVVVAVNRS